MDLNNIQLSAGQAAELYGSHLVVTEAPVAKPVTAVPQTAAGITGKNKKQLLWLVNEPSYPLLSDEDFIFLGDILAACKMNMDDISLINHACYQQSFDEMAEQLNPQIIINSAAASVSFPVSPNQYQPNNYNNIQLLFTDSLQTIRQNRELKGKLWLALKQILHL